ncbi:MAG: hypothetical protein H7246_22585 [Phycisphaerae bacterium]|nr:hypothetical protein [Saprospiraceae bacterium]
MYWKKTWPFFAWQSIRYAKNQKDFQQIWSNKKNWFSSFSEGRNSVSDELPWINYFGRDYLKQILRPDFKVFEFGGGGSTLYFCKNVAEVVTVEDNLGWFKILTETVQAKGYTNWRGFFVPSEILNDPRPRSHVDPADFKSSNRSLENMSFEKYARTIDQFPEAYFDLILVDGRARPSCTQQAIPRLKKGGFLVVDNTERSHYLAHFQDIIAMQFTVEEDRIGPIAYTPDFTGTTILRKK